MIYLLLALAGSGVIPVLFRAFETWRINLFWAIPVNYLACITIGSVLAQGRFGAMAMATQPWIWLAAVQGFLLAVNFFLLARTAQRAGVAIAALASRVSVAVPAFLAFFLYGDSLTLMKVAGLAAALVALYLCTAPERGTAQQSSRLLQNLPVLVFVTFGCYFSILKYLQTHYLDASMYHAYVMCGFIFAFATAITIGFTKGVIARAEFRLRHVVAGLFLGMVNYLAVYALLRVLALQGWESSQIFPIYSVGVVAVSAVLAVLLFKERLSRQKTFGLAVGMLAVILLNR